MQVHFPGRASVSSTMRRVANWKLLLFFAETVSQAQLASLEARHTVSSGADEGRPNMAAAPPMSKRTGTGIRWVVGGGWCPSCQSHRCHLEVAARVWEHAAYCTPHKKQRPASATCAGYREESN